jgi:hypothetical protein
MTTFNESIIEEAALSWLAGLGYTFAPYKVLWREMGDNAFAAAYSQNFFD